jgi:S-adenosylmethionine hydrolase
LGPVISLTTDFGSADGYQGVLEGVIAGINPEARVVPISHDVPPQDIIGGWYLLKTHHQYFPPGTIHLAVVDPGVGSRRKIIAVNTARYCFIAPDNGLLSFIESREIVSIHSVTDRRYALGSISPVFHGRDIMAPAAAYLSRGVDPSCLGRKVREIKRLRGISPVRRGRRMMGRVIWIDRFGNLVTNITADEVTDKQWIVVNGEKLGRIVKSFSDVRRGRPLAYIGSGGHLEIAVREGSAYRYFPSVERKGIEIEVASS